MVSRQCINGRRNGYALQRHGVEGAFVLIAGCMGVVMLAVAVLGPKTSGRQLESI